MKNIVLSILIVLSLTACWGKPEIVREYVEVPVPVAVVPKPPEVQRPILATEVLTEYQKNNIGELVKAHRVALQQSIKYATILERIIAVYDRLHLETTANIDSLRPPLIAGSSQNSYKFLEIPDFSDPLTYYENVFETLNRDILELQDKNYVEID